MSTNVPLFAQNAIIHITFIIMAKISLETKNINARSANINLRPLIYH